MADTVTFERATVGWAPVSSNQGRDYVWHVYQIDGYGDVGWPLCDLPPTVDKDEMIESGILEDEPPEGDDLCPECEDAVEYDPSGPFAHAS